MKNARFQFIGLVLLSACVGLTSGCRPPEAPPAVSQAAPPVTPPAAAPVTANKIPLQTDLPKPLFVGTPVPIKGIPNLEPKMKGPRPEFLVPAGTVNLAKGKKVTASDSEPVIGTLDLITDGDKEGDEGSWVEFSPGKQWVQIDLEKESEIFAVMLWHFHSQERVYKDVVVQVSNDPKFEKDVTTIFDDTPGTGQDLAYIETYQGKLIDAKGVKGRYVRLYSNGNTTNKMNHYIEIEVFGLSNDSVVSDKSKVPLKTAIPKPLFQ